MDIELEEALKNLRRFANSERFKKYCEEQEKPKQRIVSDAHGNIINRIFEYSDGSIRICDAHWNMLPRKRNTILTRTEDGKYEFRELEY